MRMSLPSVGWASLHLSRKCTTGLPTDQSSQLWFPFLRQLRLCQVSKKKTAKTKNLPGQFGDNAFLIVFIIFYAPFNSLLNAIISYPDDHSHFHSVVISSQTINLLCLSPCTAVLVLFEVSCGFPDHRPDCNPWSVYFKAH